MMKWWWKYQCEERQPEVERPKPKGFWVECLTAENFDPAQELWADHFIATLENVLVNYSNATAVPELKDPGLDNEVIKTSMTIEEFCVFLDTVKECLEQAKAARDAEDKVESSEIWRDIFGEEFPLYDTEESEASRNAAKATQLGSWSHAKLLPWDYKPRSGCKIRLDAHIYHGNRRLSGVNSNGRSLPAGLSIKYVAKTRASEPFEVHWQVVNTGAHATRENGLRGNFFQAHYQDGSPSASHINWESTQYMGKHWIECFIVKNGTCVARSGKFFVTIKSSR